MSELGKLPNIGVTLEKRLDAVGIHTIQELNEMGSKEAFTRMRIHEGDTCINTLCALEGAIQGIRWHYLKEETKNELIKFFDTFK